MEKRMSHLFHPDLPFDASTTATKSDAASSSKKWRPSWLSKSSGSTRSRRSSGRASSSFTQSSTTSKSLSITTATSDIRNVYQLPPGQGSGIQADTKISVLPSMRYDLDDEVFEFPVPAVLLKSSLPQSMPPSTHSHNAGLPALSQTGNERPSKQTRRSDRRDSRTKTARTRSMATSSNKGGYEGTAEVEMASREQYGYWRASLTARLPAVVAICGSVLLTTTLPSQPIKDFRTLDSERLDQDVCAFCIALEESSTAEEALTMLHSKSVEVIICALQASLEAAQVPSIPTKLAMSMYGKIAEAQNNPQKREDLFPSMIKLLRKVPQEIMVMLLFLLSIARRLQRRGITIDGQNPAVFLLSCMWPCSLALSPDPTAASSASKLLAIHYDEIPDDLPLFLEAVNHRFRLGKRQNILSLMANKREPAIYGPAGVKDIQGAEDKNMQW